MLKKFLLILICFLTLTYSNNFALSRDPKPQLKPLKIEEKSYKYGNIEKTLRNPAAENNDSYATNDESRKTTSVLDIINTVLLLLLCFMAMLFLALKIRGISLKNMMRRKEHNKFYILSAKQLGNGKTVYLVELNGRQIIVGTTESKVDSIMPLDKSYSTEEIPSEYIEKLFNDTSSEFKNLEE